MLDALKPFSKAVAATLAGGVVAFLIKHNIIIADGLADSIEIIISAVIMGVAVYLAPKNSTTK